jgi:Protein of unknown function (DUF3987)
MSDQPNTVDIITYLRRVVEPRTVIELRILGVVDNPRYPAFTVSGYFDHEHLNELAQQVVQGNWIAEGIFVTINPVNPALLARSANRLTRKPAHTTKDDEILRRTGLVFDCDPVRPAGISATDAEKTLALERMSKLVTVLTERGWPTPIMSDSGNGGHARYRIDLANNDGSHDLVKRVLEAADSVFSDAAVKVDTALSNAARIIKLPGTLARKGDNTPDRPHRLAKVLFMADDFQVVPVELLESFANDHQPAPKTAAGNGPPQASGFEMTATDGASPESRARAYVFSAGFPDSIAGDHGHDRLYHVACVLVDGFGLARGEALPIFQDWNAQKAIPPESDKQLAHKLDDVIKNHAVPSCKLLNAPRPNSRGTKATPPEGDLDEPPIPMPEWPAPLDPAAYHGLAGEIVRAIEPHTEADPAALLVQLLIGFGNVIGHNPHVVIGRKWHHCNENAVLVGLTGSGRKGTAWHDIKCFLQAADDVWCKTRIMGGLSSGEGLIHAVRDPLEGKVPIKDKGKILRYEDAVTEPGVDDKRLLTLESEFGGVLQALARDGNRLSSVIRQAWDGDILGTLTKSSPHRATDSHISIIGHITFAELTKLLSECDQANGFSNRILWICTKRSKLLPRGGVVPQDDFDRLSKRLAKAVSFARHTGQVQWTAAALELWDAAYPGLTASRPGAFGHATSRAEAHATRLGTLYGLMDQSGRIEPDDLRAALALGDYSQRSAAHIFGDKLGDKDADAILDALRSAPEGMTRTEIRRIVFHDNKAASLVASKLGILLQHELARFEKVATGKRPAERWFAISTCSTCDVINVSNVVINPTPDRNHVENVNHGPRSTENNSPESTPPPTEREVFEL